MAKTINLTRAHALRYCTSGDTRSVYMSVDDFLQIERNPHQRCERLRTNKLHLRKLVPAHSGVDIAIMPDGSLYKLNGHTRAFMWGKNKLERPKYLVVNVYSCETLDQVTDYYEHFDNNAAAKKGADTMQSGAHKAGVEFKTSWLKAGKYASMLSLACTHAGISLKMTPKIDLVGKFKRELVLFDAIPDLKRDNFKIGFGAGALLALRKHGASAVDFIDAFNKGLGVNHRGQKNAVQFLTEYLAEKRAAKRLAGIQANIEHCAFFLACFERFRNGDKRLTKRPTPPDLKTYLPVASKPTPRGRLGSSIPASPVALAA